MQDQTSVLQQILQSIDLYKYLIIAVFVAFFAAMMRKIRDKSAWFVESTFCVLIVIGLWAIIHAINDFFKIHIPEVFIIGIAMFIGLQGSEWAQDISRRQAEKALSSELDVIKTQIEKIDQRKKKDDV